MAVVSGVRPTGAIGHIWPTHDEGPWPHASPLASCHDPTGLSMICLLSGEPKWVGAERGTSRSVAARLPLQPHLGRSSHAATARRSVLCSLAFSRATDAITVQDSTGWTFLNMVQHRPEASVEQCRRPEPEVFGSLRERVYNVPHESRTPRPHTPAWDTPSPPMGTPSPLCASHRQRCCRAGVPPTGLRDLHASSSRPPLGACLTPPARRVGPD